MKLKNKILQDPITFFIYLIIFLSMVSFAYLFYQFENLLFNIINYRWSGIGDIFFWLLTLSESYIGVWATLFFIPKKLGIENLKNIFLENFPKEVERYKIAILLGLPMGLAFSGIWKLILIAMHFIY